MATVKQADVAWSAHASEPKANGKATVTITGPDGVTMGESGSRAGKATHVVVRESNPEVSGSAYWLERSGHPYGYSIHGTPDSAQKAYENAQSERHRQTGELMHANSWLVPVERG